MTKIAFCKEVVTKTVCFLGEPVTQIAFKESVPVIEIAFLKKAFTETTFLFFVKESQSQRLLFLKQSARFIFLKTRHSPATRYLLFQEPFTDIAF